MPVDVGTFTAHALVVEERAADDLEVVADVYDFGAFAIALLRLEDMLVSRRDLAVDTVDTVGAVDRWLLCTIELAFTMRIVLGVQIPLEVAMAH